MNVDLIDKLHALVTPRGEHLSDTGWLEKLPQDDYLTAQGVVLQRLREFVSSLNPYHARALQALLQIDERSRHGVAVLAQQYISAPVLQYEIDERLWNTVHNHYLALERAYQAFLDRHRDNLAESPIADLLPQLLLNLVDCLRSLAKWRYLRYQSMAEGGWLRLHRLYQLGERLGCSRTPLSRYPGGPQTTLMASYMQALMLDTLNHTSMLKPEIEAISTWLLRWCESLTLDTEYDEARHLFFVGLEQDRGGRRIRHFEPQAGYRYWDTDPLVLQAERLGNYARQNAMPPDLGTARSLSPADCLLLSEHMLAEWSRQHYRRQRRQDERDEVAKMALVVHGVSSVCQHVKNALYNRGHAATHDELNPQPLPTSEMIKTEPPEPQGEIVLPGALTEKWNILNESKYGFGAVVNGELNRWLRPGRLIALDYDLNPDMPAVGVVRSVQHLPGDMRHVGIEVLSHTPTYVGLRNLSSSAHPQEFLRTDLFVSAVLSGDALDPFGALYLPQDETRDTPSSLLLPRVEFVAGGVYELRTDSHHSQVRLGRVIEQKDDWVRVEVQLPEV